MHHLPSHCQWQLRQPLSQIQFKFLSGIYFGHRNPATEIRVTHQLCHRRVAASSACCPAPFIGLALLIARLKPVPHLHFRRPFFLVILHIECCNFNPLMDLMRVSVRFFFVQNQRQISATNGRATVECGLSKLKLMTPAAASAVMPVTDTHKCVVVPP